MEIINPNIWSFFKASYWLWRYHLSPSSKRIFSWKIRLSTVQGCISDYRYIQGTSRQQELGLESLKSKRWQKRLGCIFKIMMEEVPTYLMDLIAKSEQNVRTNNNNMPTYHCRKDCLKYSFFPSTFNDWFNLDDSITDSESISIFKCRLSFILAIQNNVYNIFDPKGLKFLTRSRLAFSHLDEDRLRHNFQDYWNHLCCFSLEIKDTLHYLLHCCHFSQHRSYSALFQRQL